MLVEGDDELVGGVWREKENDCVFGSKQMNLIFSVNDGVLAVIGSVCLFSVRRIMFSVALQVFDE